MSNEDKMRDDFYRAFPKFAGILEMVDAGSINQFDAMTAIHQFNVWKTCASIKDAEIAEIKKTAIYNTKEFASLQEKYKFERQLLDGQIAARDLMIKEKDDLLRDFLGNYDFGSKVDARIVKALAKSEHHNSRALEKLLLEAELKVLCDAYDCCKPYGVEFLHMMTEREAKLAELTKE